MFDEQAGLPVDYRQQANALIEKVFGKEQSIGPYKRRSHHRSLIFSVHNQPELPVTPK